MLFIVILLFSKVSYVEAHPYHSVSAELFGNAERQVYGGEGLLSFVFLSVHQIVG